MRERNDCSTTRKFLGNYVPKYTKHFKRQIRKLDKKLKQRIKQKIEDLRQDPYHNAPFAKGQWKGKRHIYINRTDRLLFAICEECRKEKHQAFNGCSDCDQLPENTFVVFICIFGHKYKRGW